MKKLPALIALSLSILFLAFPTFAKTSFNQLKEITTISGDLEGNFTQDKYLHALDATLTSTGIFSYRRKVSVRWETLEPIHSEFLMTPNEVISRQAEQELFRMNAADNPVISILNKIFFSVLTAEWENLALYFQIADATIEKENWQVELLPLDKAILQVVQRVELKGDIFLREIVLHEKDGNRTTIHFSDLAASNNESRQ